MDPRGVDHSGQAHLADNAVSQQPVQIQIPSNCKRRLVNRTHTVASLLKKKREGAHQPILEIESSVHQIPTILETESSVNQSRSTRERTIRCALCSETFHWLALLTDHLRRRHGVRTRVQTLQFENMDLFMEWKEKMEVNTKSFYHCRRTLDREKRKTIYFTCNRSGMIERRPDGVRKRGIKVRGYRKTGNSCPARITLVQSKQQGVPLRVKFFETHIGHDQDVGHLNFPKSTRRSLAAQLLRGIPPKTIIENVRNNFNRTGRPYKIPTLRDLLNIRSGFLHVNRKSEFPAEDDDGVDMFVQNSQQESQKSYLDVDISIPDSEVVGNDLHLVSAVTAEHNTTSHQFQVEKVTIGKVESCFSRRQKELIVKFSGLVRSCSKWGELDVIAHHLDTIGPELEAIRRDSLPPTLPVAANVSHNATKKQYGRKTIGTIRQMSQTNHYSHVDSGAFCSSPPDVVARGSKLTILPSPAILTPIMSGLATRPTVILQTRTIRSIQPPFPKIIVADTESHALAAENNNIYID